MLNDITQVNTEEFSSLLSYLTSPDSVITNIHTLDCYNDYPKFYQFITEYKNQHSSIIQLKANGIAFNKKVALVKAVMETLERWYLVFSKTDEFIYDSYENLMHKKINVLHPSLFLSFSESQYKSRKFSKFKCTSKTFYHWCYVNDIQGNPYLIPAHLIYFSHQEKNLLRIPDSTGAAAGFSFEQALYSGICEALERDAFALFYFGNQNSSRLDLTTITDPDINRLITYIQKYLFEIEIFDITSNIGISTFLTILIDKTDKGPKIVVGSKCDTHPKIALYGSIMESLQALTASRDHMTIRKSFSKSYWNKDLYDEQSRKRYSIWSDPKAVDYLESLFRMEKAPYIASKSSFPIPMNDKLKQLVKILKENKLNIFWKQTSPRHLEKYSIFAVKVIIPELTPLSIHCEMPYLGGERLLNLRELTTNNRRSASIFQEFSITHPLS